MVERRVGSDSALEERIDEAVVKVQARDVHTRPTCENARPRDGEAIGVDTERGHARDVVAVPVVVVAGHVAGRTVVDRAGPAAEDVPDGWLLAVSVVRSLDLVRARRHAEDEVPRKLHFSTPVMTMPRMNARCAKKKIATGTTMDMTAAAWIRVGFCE